MDRYNVAYAEETLYVRLSGAESAIKTASRELGGEYFAEGAAFWSALREQTHPFFSGAAPLRRLSLPPATPPLALSGDWLWEWGGAQRWLRSPLPADAIRQAVTTVGGHATLFRGGDRQGQVFQPLDPVVRRLHLNLKRSFDPQGIFNPGRMYPDC